jgi:hypothetical protein
MIVRIAFGLVFMVATAMVLLPICQRLFKRAGALPWLLGVFAASRLGGWAAAYVVAPGLVRHSDLVLYYYPEALRALQGDLPYRDFPTSYGPLFPYVAATFLSLWNDQAAVALAMVLFEIAAVVLFARVAATRTDLSPDTLIRALLVYAVNPAALYWSGLLAYNSSIVLFFWVLALALLLWGRYAASLVALAASVIAGKFLAVLAGPVWLADRRRRPGLLVAAGALAVVGALALRAAGLDLLLPLAREGGRSTAGNVWFLVSAIPFIAVDGAIWRFGPFLSFVAAAGALIGWLALRWTTRPNLVQLCAAISAFSWLFMLLMKKSYPHYTPMFLLLTVFALADTTRGAAWRLLLLAAAGAVGIIEPGLWNALGQPALLRAACAGGCSPTALALIAADVILIGTAVALLPALLRAASYGSGLQLNETAG